MAGKKEQVLLSAAKSYPNSAGEKQTRQKIGRR